MENFDMLYEKRKILSEIALLEVFRDISFSKKKNYKTCHKISQEIMPMILLLNGTFKEFPDCKTFGDLKKANFEEYSRIKDSLLWSVDNLGYSFTP